MVQLLGCTSKGQRQYGIDVYGHPQNRNEIYHGAQCKLRTKGDQLSQSEIEEEVADAKLFPHKLEKLIIATDASRDTATQILIDKINNNEVNDGGFKVVIWFWEDITERLAAFPRLIVKYFKDFFTPLTSLPHVERLVDIPLRVGIESTKPSNEITLLVDHLRFRGIQILNNGKISLSDSDTVDGLIIVLGPGDFEQDHASHLKLVSIFQFYSRALESDCPIFVITPNDLISSINKLGKTIDLDLTNAQYFDFNQSIIEIAENIFNLVFTYGYFRRGGISTIEICARTQSSKPNPALLDVNWSSKLSPTQFPTPKEWKTHFIPALETLQHTVLGQGDIRRIQINSLLPIPGAIAFGYYFNIRSARVGVWARKSGSSDFKEQFWLSSSTPELIRYSPKFYKSQPGISRSTILELTSYVSIHESVQKFIDSIELEVDIWAKMGLEIDGATPENILEAQAVAFANQVGQLIRQFNQLGITDIYLFCRIPSTLGVLIGQRLFACGRIHLFWFDNPTYRYAFTLS